MKLIELLTGPWAILPESLREIRQIYATHLKGEKIDLEAVEARLGRPLANEQKRYELRDGGIAVLAVDGVLAPKANLFTKVSGGASFQMLSEQMLGAAADSRVRAVVQLIDSPGGSVFGMYEYAEVVRRVAQEKPVVTVSEGTVASAAYLAGAAANAIYLTGPAVQAGSIGIYARMELSQAEPGAMEFVRGKYKRSAINGESPSADYMAYFEAGLDHHYSTFVDTVATYRATSSDLVLERMAEGRVFIGQQALSAGLADGIASLDDIVERLATDPSKFAARRKAVFALGAVSETPAGAQALDHSQEPAGVQVEGSSVVEPVLLATSTNELPKGTAMPLTREQIEAEAPDLVKAFRAEGASAECERIKGVEAQLIPGHEAVINAMKFDGKSTAGDAAMAVNAAERQSRQAAAAASAAAAPQPVPVAPLAGAAAQGSSGDASASGDPEVAAKAAWDKDAGLRAEFGGNFAAYQAYAKASASGQVRIHNPSKA